MSRKKICVGDYSIIVNVKCETTGSCGIPCPTRRTFNGGGTTKRKIICKTSKCTCGGCKYPRATTSKCSSGGYNKCHRAS